MWAGGPVQAFILTKYVVEACTYNLQYWKQWRKCCEIDRINASSTILWRHPWQSVCPPAHLRLTDLCQTRRDSSINTFSRPGGSTSAINDKYGVFANVVIRFIIRLFKRSGVIRRLNAWNWDSCLSVFVQVHTDIRVQVFSFSVCHKCRLNWYSPRLSFASL